MVHHRPCASGVGLPQLNCTSSVVLALFNCAPIVFMCCVLALDSTGAHMLCTLWWSTCGKRMCVCMVWMFFLSVLARYLCRFTSTRLFITVHCATDLHTCQWMPYDLLICLRHGLSTGCEFGLSVVALLYDRRKQFLDGCIKVLHRDRAGIRKVH
jgi:hypothetical protein